MYNINLNAIFIARNKMKKVNKYKNANLKK